MELNIEDLRKICFLENIEITMHAARRLEQRGILIKDIMDCIKNGEIIEQYPADYPYPSCLILGKSEKGSHMHAVVGSDMKTLWIVTAYFPDVQRWEDNFKIRKEIGI